MNKQDKDRIKYLYFELKRLLENVWFAFVPCFRRLLRFLALPYCYFRVNWNECTASRYQVMNDFLYIFFKLKYFPDNYSKCRLWQMDRNQWGLYYGSIYDPYQRAKLRKEVHRLEYQIVYDDKEICHNLCKLSGLPVPKVYACVDESDDYRGIITSILYAERNRDLIIKPVRGSGGKGVRAISKEGDEIIVYADGKKLLLDEFKLSSRSLIQESVPQHDSLSRIYPFSVNTLRIQTLLTKEKRVIMLGAMIRFGRNNARVDNLSSGGLGVGIDIEKGTLKAVGHDFQSKTYLSHPDTRIAFINYPIPFWGEVVKLVKEIHQKISYYKLLGHDIAVTPKGPVIIEINDQPDNVMMEQCCGPILADKTVRHEFRKYNLLINKAIANDLT